MSESLGEPFCHCDKESDRYENCEKFSHCYLPRRRRPRSLGRQVQVTRQAPGKCQQWQARRQT
jgi:hypothetical protein